MLPDTEIVGTSGDRGLLAKAAKMGAFDTTSGNLRTALRGAGMVVLDVAAAETREMMEAIGPVLESECVVTDTGTNKVEVLEWAKSYFGGGVSFVGGRPLPKERLDEVEAASPSVFDNIEYCVIPADGAAPGAVKTIVGMVELLGARPLFMDAHEHDSYAAAVAHLPRLLSSALVTLVSSGAPWREISRLAGAEFKQVSQFAADDPQDSTAACLANPEALAYWIDQAIAELASYRVHVREGGDGLLEAFARAHVERAKWEADVVVEEERPEIPSMGQTMAGMFVGRRLARRFRQISGGGKPPGGSDRKSG